MDWDIQTNKRQQVIEYVVKKYGEECVSQIITFGMRKAKSAVRSVGRALEYPQQMVDELAKLIPDDAKCLQDVIDNELIEIYNSDNEAKILLDYALEIEGLPANTSTHAAGVLISPINISSLYPTWINRSKITGDTKVVAVEMNMLEKLGGLKMDFLGLMTLQVIDDCRHLIHKRSGVFLTDDDLYAIAYTPEAYTLIASGNTQGIFQLEGQGMRQTAMEMKPSTLEELTALVSLYRPGPMDFIPTYLKNKNDPDNIEYPFDSLKDLLKETYGVVVYQEQVIFAVQVLAGYSMAEADNIRKAMGKFALLYRNI